MVDIVARLKLHEEHPATSAIVAATCELARLEIERLRAAQDDAEIALLTWDEGRNSEYWLRHPERAGEGLQPARTCATCHAVLAPGPQPAATYEQSRDRRE